ncbi:unnamed protein product [Adineta ricciae]|uniref:TIR domain-containing protein n=1 Tax=Adineta ricciae TaxID=249248 RepID=A0A813TFJ8_ADIRI|nr:unnamed protein product [Adineta ricciae]CAF0811756.1 unnamed protein product [Adineta ricciae]
MYQYQYMPQPYQQYSQMLNMYQILPQYMPMPNPYQSLQQYSFPPMIYQPTQQYVLPPTIYQPNVQYNPVPVIPPSPQQYQATPPYSPAPISQQPSRQYELSGSVHRPIAQRNNMNGDYRTVTPKNNKLEKSTSSVLSQHCQTIKQKAQSISTLELQNLLDQIQNELNTGENSKQNTNNIQEFLSALIPVKTSTLATVARHSIFQQLRAPLVQYLRQWRRESSLNENDVFLFRSIIRLLTKLLRNVTQLNQYPTWLLNPILLEMVAGSLTDISQSDRLSKKNNQRESRSFMRLFDLYIKYGTCLEKEKTFNKDVLNQLIDPVVQCLKSDQYVDLFSKQGSSNKTTKMQERFFLHKCPSFLTSYHGSRLEQTMESLLSTMLPQYLTLFNELIFSIQKWKPFTKRAVAQLITLINHGPTTPKLLVAHLPLIDHILTIINTSSLYNKLAENISNPETMLMNSAVHFLANMIAEPTVLAHIKQKNMAPTFLRLTSAKYEPLVYDIYTILAYTTSEKDIKEMQNPGKLLSTVTRSLKEVVFGDESNDESQVSQLLEILKGLSQHDQIKEEILKQNELTFLLECTKKFQGDLLTLLLETLWALSFSQNGALQLRNHPEFLEKIQNISKNSNDEGTKKASDGLVWKLVQEPAFLEKVAKNQQNEAEGSQQQEIETTEVIIGPDGKEQIVTKTKRVDIAPAEQTFQYDMMISYCHADKDLIYKIHQFLLDQGFKIWIDLNNMFGPAMSAMAEAVENSEFVLLCMSDSYKQSTYCQAEAEYAFGCKRRLLPLIVRPGYRPDGWLGFMIGSRIYVDFGRFDFDTACEKLMNEISLQRKRPLPSKEGKMGQHEKPDNKPAITQVVVEKPSAASVSLPPPPSPASVLSGKLPNVYTERKARLDFDRKHIYNWTEQDVLDFLFHNRVHELMPLCEKMDGRALIQLYKMCTSHSKSTYTLLSDELKLAYQVKLPIGIFTRFLSVMERIGALYIQSSQSTIQVKGDSQISVPSPPIASYSSMLTLPAPVPLQKSSTPPYYRRSDLPYDIIVTSNASTPQVLKMAERLIPRIESWHHKKRGQPFYIR